MHKNNGFFHIMICISVIQRELSALRLSLGNHQLIDSAESSGHQVGDGGFFHLSD